MAQAHQNSKSILWHKLAKTLSRSYGIRLPRLQVDPAGQARQGSDFNPTAQAHYLIVMI